MQNSKNGWSFAEVAKQASNLAGSSLAFAAACGVAVGACVAAWAATSLTHDLAGVAVFGQLLGLLLILLLDSPTYLRSSSALEPSRLNRRSWSSGGSCHG
jgi:hypothetical protein